MKSIHLGQCRFDAGGVLDTNKEKYISKYFRFTEPLASAGTPAKYQLQVNGASLPAYKMNRSVSISTIVGKLVTLEIK